MFQPDSLGHATGTATTTATSGRVPGGRPVYTRRFPPVWITDEEANCGYNAAEHIQRFLTSLPFDQF
jgi:hypothetical protein